MNTRSKQLRTDGRRNEILTSASQAIRRLGLRGAGMRQIADAAGLSAGNLYYYFRNKQELVYFCQDQTLDALHAVAREAREQPSAGTQLALLIRGHLRVLLDTRTAGAVHLEFLGPGAQRGVGRDELPAELYRKLVAKRDRYERAVRALIEDGQKHREVRPGDPKLQAFALLGALNWAARWWRPSGAHTVDEVAGAFIDQLLGGLLQ